MAGPIDPEALTKQYYYFSMQYSGIQKTVMRHDRLWSVAGISNMLSRMNELEMPKIAKDNQGTAIVAGGGKFTARFDSSEDAEQARAECVRLIATTLPMLEFQVSKVHKGSSFQALKDANDRSIVIAELGEQKRRFRGYGVTFNPHLQLCNECGEYPVQDCLQRGKKSTPACRICKVAFEESRRIYSEIEADTSLQKVYHGYLREVKDACDKKPPADFKDLFPKKNDGSDTDGRNRMAVWFSDLNNMNDKVPVWLKQDEGSVLNTFTQFRDTVVNIIVTALAMTFPDPTGEFLPFRLVVAGGDDLCLVMAEKDILEFTKNISTALNKAKDELTDDHPLSDTWLRENGDFSKAPPKPFGFGGSFVVTSIHTPFSQIHALGEELMSTAKKKTDRQGNSVNWRIMAEDASVTENLLKFERPLFIENSDRGKSGLDALTFNDYLNLRKTYKNIITTSHRQQIIGFMIRHRMNGSEVERQMKMLDSSERPKDFSGLLNDQAFREDGDIKKNLLPERIATLFELLSIKEGDDE